MSSKEVIIGLESIIGNGKRSYLPSHYYYRMNEQDKKTESLLDIIGYMRRLGWHPKIATTKSHQQVLNITSSEYIAGLPRVDMRKKDPAVPYGILYEPITTKRIVIGTPPISYYPVGHNGSTMLITEKDRAFHNIGMIEDILRELMVPNDEGVISPCDRFDQRYNSLEDEVPLKGSVICSTNVVSPILPVYSNNPRGYNDNGNEYLMRYSVIGNSTDNKKNKLRIFKIVHTRKD
ncbi:MAG: hypothetical protein ACMXYL_02055 [Candidatus Woesearchaeota archaeon]